MSRSRKDQKGGHPHGGYDKESSVAKEITREKRRAAGKRSVTKYIPCTHCNDEGVACDMAGEIIADPCWCIDNEKFETNPERSTQGWMTY